MKEYEIQVTIPYSQFEKMKQQVDNNSIKICNYFYDNFPFKTSVEYLGKDEAIKKIVVSYQSEINSLQEENKKLQEKLNKKHWWNKEKSNV